MSDERHQILARTGTVQTATGSYNPPATTKRTELITADWKTNLVMEGLVFRATVGTVAAGGDVTMITGGGAGTTIDQDQPELAVGVRAGFYLVPLQIDVSTRAKLDADADKANIIVTADRAATVPADGTKTAETPLNLLDGGPAFTGDANSAYTADMTDYTVSDIIAHAAIMGNDNGAAASHSYPNFALHYKPDVPEFIEGPGAFYIHWGGTQATEGTCTAIFAVVPTSYLA